VNRSTFFSSLLVFTIALALYLVTLAPTITWAHHGADGGDLITAAYVLGVPHPPGYPAYVTLGHLFAQWPIGDVAYRLNLMSAICMALAAALTTCGIIQVTPTLSLPRFTREGIAMLGGLSFAAAPMVWGQATIAEVHALNALYVAAIVCLLAPRLFRHQPVPTYQLALTFFVWGLSLGNLITIVALVPLTFLAARRSLVTHHSHLPWRAVPGSLVSRHSSPVTPHSSLVTHYSLLIISFLLGLSIYWLVPLRAATHPPIDWGNATTPANFIAHVTAALYRGYAFGVPLGEYPMRAVALAQSLVAQFGWIGVLLGASGLRRVLINSKAQTTNIVALALTLAAYMIFALGYNTTDSDLYLIPVWLFGAWAIAFGSLAASEWIISRINDRQPTRNPMGFSLPLSAFILLLIALVPGLTIAANYPAMNLRDDRAAENFARAILARAPANAILITHSDAHTFTLWYYRLVEGQRPDTAIVDARLAGIAWYDQMLAAQGHAPRLPDLDPEATWPARLAAANPNRPVCEVDAATANMRCP
jgi:hypothetical protein